MAININGSTGISGVDGSAGTPALQGTDTNTGISFGTDVILASTAGSERFRVDSSGRLLVGTSTSASAGNAAVARIQTVGNSFQAFGSGVVAISRGEAAADITSGEAIGNITFGDSSGNEFGLIQCIADAAAGTGDYPGRLVFSTTADGASSPTERMRINANGAITTPATATSNHSFGVNHSGNIIAEFVNSGSSIPYGLVVTFSAASPNDTSRYFLSCSDSTTTRAVIRSNGGLANYSANNVNLSDINSKKDIAHAAGTWDCLKEWEIVNFRYKDQPDDADLNMGVIAQQVAESCPEVITVFQEAKEATETEPAQEERLGVKDQQMMWMAIKALQEAQIRIETLEAKVAALEAS